MEKGQEETWQMLGCRWLWLWLEMKKKNGGDVKKDIHGYEQKYFFYDDILQIMLTFFSFLCSCPLAI